MDVDVHAPSRADFIYTDNTSALTTSTTPAQRALLAFDPLTAFTAGPVVTRSYPAVPKVGSAHMFMTAPTRPALPGQDAFGVATPKQVSVMAEANSELIEFEEPLAGEGEEEAIVSVANVVLPAFGIVTTSNDPQPPTHVPLVAPSRAEKVDQVEGTGGSSKGADGEHKAPTSPINDDLIEYVDDEDEVANDAGGSTVLAETVLIADEPVENDLDSETGSAFDYEPLPCVLLVHRGRTHALFNLHQGDLDLRPIFDDEHEGPALFESSLIFFIAELKKHFEIETDISLQVSHIDLTLHENAVFVESLTMHHLYEYYQGFLLQHDTSTTDTPFAITLIEHPNSVAKRLEELALMASNGWFLPVDSFQIRFDPMLNLDAAGFGGNDDGDSSGSEDLAVSGQERSPTTPQMDTTSSQSNIEPDALRPDLASESSDLTVLGKREGEVLNKAYEAPGLGVNAREAVPTFDHEEFARHTGGQLLRDDTFEIVAQNTPGGNSNTVETYADFMNAKKSNTTATVPTTSALKEAAKMTFKAKVMEAARSDLSPTKGTSSMNVETQEMPAAPEYISKLAELLQSLRVKLSAILHVPLQYEEWQRMTTPEAIRLSNQEWITLLDALPSEARSFREEIVQFRIDAETHFKLPAILPPKILYEGVDAIRTEINDLHQSFEKGITEVCSQAMVFPSLVGTSAGSGLPMWQGAVAMLTVDQAVKRPRALSTFGFGLDPPSADPASLI
ncbi:hypothetical protein HKX48_000069 [Thoreauomyces humboldtii]|nr:hypothetical protein HKX48_000069 [Thoreauomyces humboldtii]